MTNKTKETLGGVAFVILFLALLFGVPWLHYGLTGKPLQFGGPSHVEG